MAEKLNLNRNQLREFLKDHESVKQFEKLFWRSNSDSATIEVISSRVAALENPAGLFITSNHQAGTDAYWIAATASGLIVTLPPCASAILGKTWDMLLLTDGTLTVQTSPGDTFATPDTATETSLILNTKGSAISMRCISVGTWGFA